MHDTLRSTGPSHDMDRKDHDTHLEQVATRTPPSEMEKGQPLKPIASSGPAVHEKVNSTDIARRRDRD
jgi:hypothetical protein